MLAIAILTTLVATAMLIATAITFHAGAGEDRRRRVLARQRSDHLRRRSI